MSATFCRFTMIGRVLTQPRRITYNKDGAENVLCSFIIGTEPNDAEDGKKAQYSNCYNIQAYGKIAKSILNNFSKDDYVYMEGYPKSVKVAGHELGNTLFFTNYVAQYASLLNRAIKTAHDKEI